MPEKPKLKTTHDDYKSSLNDKSISESKENSEEDVVTPKKKITMPEKPKIKTSHDDDKSSLIEKSISESKENSEEDVVTPKKKITML